MNSRKVYIIIICLLLAVGCLYLVVKLTVTQLARQVFDDSVTNSGQVESLTYEDFKVGLVKRNAILSNLSFNMPGQPVPWEIEEVEVIELDIANPRPEYMKVRFDNINVPLANLRPRARGLEKLGYTDKIIAEAYLDFTYNNSTRELDIKALDMNYEDLGRLSLSLHITNFDPYEGYRPENLIEYMGVEIHSVKLKIADDSFINRFITAESARSGRDPTAVKAEIQTWIQAQSTRVRSEDGRKLIDALLRFVEEEDHLEINISPESPVSVGEIFQLILFRQYDSVIRRLSVTAET